MIAVGIDIGGTKIEAQVFADDWSVSDSKRIATPQNYDALIGAIAEQVAWADAVSNVQLPIGIGAAGLINPKDGLALTANLPATGKPFPADIATRLGRAITYLNDCRALTLAEAVFGAGKDHHTVMSLIFGTGVGGGIAVDGQLLAGPTQTGGEFGHIAASAYLVSKYNLPIVSCGCGRTGCIETLISGSGLSRIAKAVSGRIITPPELIANRASDPEAQLAWSIWCELSADLLCSLIFTVDPDCIVLGGGLSTISGVAADLQRVAENTQLKGFAVPPIVTAQGGDASGARGAAYAALQQAVR